MTTSRSSAPLGDRDPMPIGKHKGKPLEEVPAETLLWMGNQSWIRCYPRLRRYIEENRQALEQEADEVRTGNAAAKELRDRMIEERRRGNQEIPTHWSDE